MKAVDVVVCGHLCLDLLPKMEHVPLAGLASPGKLFEVGALGVSTGGAVGNTGLALHRLGTRVRLMANVGDDLIGRAIQDHLAAHSPTLIESIRIKPGEAGSYSIVLTPEKADRLFLHCTGTNTTFGIDDIDFSAALNTKIFHLGYPTLLPRLLRDDGEELAALYQHLYAAGVVTSMDVTLPDPAGVAGQMDWRAILRRSLPYVDIFVPSIDEIAFMLRDGAYELSLAYLDDLADELLALGHSSIVGFKLGEHGLYLRSADQERIKRLRHLPIDANAWTNRRTWHPAFEVSVAGTTGAGDSAYAGLLTALINGLSSDEAVQMSCAVGASSVEGADAVSGVQTWQITRQRVAAGWNTRPSHLT